MVEGFGHTGVRERSLGKMRWISTKKATRPCKMGAPWGCLMCSSINKVNTAHTRLVLPPITINNDGNNDTISPLIIDYESKTEMETIAMQKIEINKRNAMCDDDIVLDEEPEGNNYETHYEEVISGLLGLALIDA
jgi:hypothetical protein